MNSSSFPSFPSVRNLLFLFLSLQLATFNLQPATIIGNLTDISLQPLDTRISFAPTNQVLISSAGLSAGPPRILQTVSGAFSIALDAGDYTVSLPLVPWRHPFCISVMDTAATINITNLLCNPRTYIYTNRFIPPLHVNTSRVTAWSTNGEISLVSSTTTIATGTLGSGNVITIEAFGSFSDPGANGPTTVPKLKLGSTTIITQTQNTGTANWHIRSQITIRSAGTSGSVVGTVFLVHDNPAMAVFPGDSQTVTVNTTGSLTVDLRASITDFTGTEAVHCDQLVIRLE